MCPAEALLAVHHPFEGRPRVVELTDFSILRGAARFRFLSDDDKGVHRASGANRFVPLTNAAAEFLLLCLRERAA